MIGPLIWYTFFGVVHECFHVIAASTVLSEIKLPTVLQFLLEAALGRCVRLEVDGEHTDDVLFSLFFIRHVGWISSLLVALALFPFQHWTSRSCRQAAILTAVEAIFTDLLCLGSAASRTSSAIFFCGNFGVILLHPKWNEDRSTVFDLLERMIQITMMRGGQSGGLVSWETQHTAEGTSQQKGKRVRMVKGKRQDISTMLSKGSKQSVCGMFGGKKNPTVNTFLGHTRFATSSMATLEGTHPHQWTPPEMRRVYPLDDEELWNSQSPRPISRMMENFVTHNGDFDFFSCQGSLTSLPKIQKWLKAATGHPVPAQVDSACIAGMMDIFRTAGCFGLSLRYAILLATPDSTMDHHKNFPAYADYEAAGKLFEDMLVSFLGSKKASLNMLKTDKQLCEDFVLSIVKEARANNTEVFESVGLDMDDIETSEFVVAIRETVQAFLTHDLFTSLKKFMAGAVGSFGIMVTSSEDANRQICLAARGQPMSVAFYPKKGLVCYGSEQAAVKSGLQFSMPGGDLKTDAVDVASIGDDNSARVATTTCRLDLDDLRGEVALLDWGGKRGESDPMVDVRVHRESGTFPDELQLREKGRVTPLDDNELLLPLPADSDDLIQRDIQEIPDQLQRIQEEWRQGGFNRMTLNTFLRAFKERLKGKLDESVPQSAKTVDILVTGCEVSLWLAEQFASDLRKALPDLNVQAISSNKILGIMGQDLSVPSIGFPESTATTDLHNTIVLIVSHSGGTFGPLAIAKLLQSVTNNLFVLTSEWDTQIGKQLRSMIEPSGSLFSSRVFSTNIGIRTAEPCSLSVAATHQMLTNIFEILVATVLENENLARAAGAVITEQDLSILERCNRDNIDALRSIVGNTNGGEWMHNSNEELLHAGNEWANHVLEGVKGYILCILYIVGTVTTGYPLVSGILTAAGAMDDSYLYIARFVDSLIYLFSPQISIFIIRLLEGRNLRHRMVGRTVVIGDIPWVSQAADSFLSKLFACSYSIAGLNVLSANPGDHLVHRHTHRVVRGTLLCCGRPDGRLSALTSSECAVNLSISQACSIQSMGGNCEAVTIGHNPTPLGLTKFDIALDTKRPQFLCERIHSTSDDNNHVKALQARQKFNDAPGARRRASRMPFDMAIPEDSSVSSAGTWPSADNSGHTGVKVPGKLSKKSKRAMILKENQSEWASTTSIKAFYLEMHQSSRTGDVFETPQDEASDTSEHKDGKPSTPGSEKPGLSRIFRDQRGLLYVEPCDELYFGQRTHSKLNSKGDEFKEIGNQSFAIELYEARIASLQRFVAMCVMFHQMGKRVQDFFPAISCGLLGYRMDRTHSIVRVATTASPVSGDSVQERMKVLQEIGKHRQAAELLLTRYMQRKNARIKALLDASRHNNYVLPLPPAAPEMSSNATDTGATSPVPKKDVLRSKKAEIEGRVLSMRQSSLGSSAPLTPPSMTSPKVETNGLFEQEENLYDEEEIVFQSPPLVGGGLKED